MNYLNAPYLWMPPTQSTSAQRLASILVWNNKPISGMKVYPHLLSQKVEWLIYQEPTLAEAYDLICSFLDYGLMQTLVKPEPTESPQQWAWAVTLYNEPLLDCLRTLSLPDLLPEQPFLPFPLLPSPMTEKTREAMTDMMLEEWLSAMSTHCHEV